MFVYNCYDQSRVHIIETVTNSLYFCGCFHPDSHEEKWELEERSCEESVERSASGSENCGDLPHGSVNLCEWDTEGRTENWESAEEWELGSEGDGSKFIIENEEDEGEWRGGWEERRGGTEGSWEGNEEGNDDDVDGAENVWEEDVAACCVSDLERGGEECTGEIRVWFSVTAENSSI